MPFVWGSSSQQIFGFKLGSGRRQVQDAISNTCRMEQQDQLQLSTRQKQEVQSRRRAKLASRERMKKGGTSREDPGTCSKNISTTFTVVGSLDRIKRGGSLLYHCLSISVFSLYRRSAPQTQTSTTSNAPPCAFFPPHSFVSAVALFLPCFFGRVV